MHGDADSVLRSTADGLRPGARRRSTAPRRSGMLAFDCIGRRGVLGDERIGDEVERIARAARGGAPVAGFYTYGEIARVTGVNGFHSQTLVVLAIG